MVIKRSVCRGFYLGGAWQEHALVAAFVAEYTATSSTMVLSSGQVEVFGAELASGHLLVRFPLEFIDLFGHFFEVLHLQMRA